MTTTRKQRCCPAPRAPSPHRRLWTPARWLRTVDRGLGPWTGDRGLLDDPRVPPPYHLGHARKVVLTLHRLDLEPPVVRAVRAPVAEAHHGRHFEGAADVRDVEALDALGRPSQPKSFGQLRQVLLRIKGQRQTVRHALEPVHLFRRLAQVCQQVAQLGGPLLNSCAAAAFFISASSCSCISAHWPSRNSHAAFTWPRYSSRLTLPMQGAVQDFRCAYRQCL